MFDLRVVEHHLECRSFRVDRFKAFAKSTDEYVKGTIEKSFSPSNRRNLVFKALVQITDELFDCVETLVQNFFEKGYK
ncbi:hypothetical protein QJS10_CPA01g01834 [Acorus calamus]|uniref:Uncharacterized protein n=1 Tax=Acorus calamus TaxID=4465 RepID=A0AAV9FMT3_ACOCL|nr:hypothetical protein QJS10_CPA01g01834 [Acorus calamus]